MIYEDIDFYKGLAIYILPDGVTNYFDLVNFSEESARESDQLYKTELHLYLDEREQYPKCEHMAVPRRPFLENLCTKAHIHIDFRLTDEAVPVHLDTVLFQQVLINIVKNAVESIGMAQGLITVEATTPATLTITDNGHGIPPATAKNLFTPFFSTKPQGQGLGLLLIRDILTSHHCTFNLLTNPEDHLTRFTIQFPIQNPQK